MLTCTPPAMDNAVGIDAVTYLQPAPATYSVTTQPDHRRAPGWPSDNHCVLPVPSETHALTPPKVTSFSSHNIHQAATTTN